MNLHVTLQTFVSQALGDTQRITDALATLQAQAATGKRLQSPADDPAAASFLAAATAQSNRLQSFLTNIGSVQSTLNQSVSTLQDVGNLMTEARSIALQANQSTNDATANSAMASQVDQILNRLINDANTQQNGNYLYAGSAANTQPFVVTQTDAQNRATQVSYQGASGNTETNIDQGQYASAFLSGKDVFQPSGANDAFQSLITLRDTLSDPTLSDPTRAQALSNVLTDIDGVSSHIQDAIGQQSAIVQRLGSLQTRLQDVQLSTKQTMSDRGDADMTQVVIGLQAQQTMLQLSLYSFSRLLNQNLLDFLK